MSFKVIVTLGPAIMDSDKLKAIDACGDCLYRINGAHADSRQAADLAGKVREIIPSARLVMDLPGNKVRTKNLAEPIKLVKGEFFSLPHSQLNYPEFYRHLKRGDIIYANDSVFKLEVQDITPDCLELISHSDGLLLNNKGLHVRGIHSGIPFLFERDVELIKAANKSGIDYISLSFVRTAGDIKTARRIIARNDADSIIAKIETAAAVENLEEILAEVENINIDRGDLSSDIGIMNLASTQEWVVETALRNRKKVFLATQFLKNMENYPVPLIAEIVDLFQSIKLGIAGIQLSEETAVGKYAVESVGLVFDSYRRVKSLLDSYALVHKARTAHEIPGTGASTPYRIGTLVP